MNELAGVLGRRRRWVVAVWVAIVVFALPFAAQPDRTPHRRRLRRPRQPVEGGHRSAAGRLRRAVGRDRGAAASAAPGASRGRARRRRRPGPPRGRRRSKGCAAAGRRAPRAAAAAAHRHRAVPLRSSQSARRADRLGRRPCAKASTPAPPQAGVTPYLVGQPTIWAGMQEISKEDLAKAEASGFPIVALILLVVFGSLAAAALPLALGFVSVHGHRRADLLHLAADDDLGLRHQHGLDDRDRGRDRLLALHPRPLPRGAPGRPRPARTPAPRRSSTSGLAVSFSGLAVIISLAGLWMVDNQALRSMALGAMTVVAVSILTATTLLPALIAMLGDRVLPGGVVGRVRALLQAPRSCAVPRPPRRRSTSPATVASGTAGRRG